MKSKISRKIRISRYRSIYMYILTVGIDSAENFTSIYLYGNLFFVKADPVSILAYTRNAKKTRFFENWQS